MSSVLAAFYQFVQSALKIGSVLAERVGQLEVGECTTLADSVWWPLQLPVEKPWSMPGEPFVFLLAQTGVENAPVRTPFVAFYAAFSPSRSGNTNQGRYP